MNLNERYIQNLKTDEVPWHRITTAYGRATEFPVYFKALWDMDERDAVEEALREITSNIEHQSTLWHASPFAIIFLVRIFDRAVSERDSNEIAAFVIEELLDFFVMIAAYFHEIGDMDHAEQLPYFSDLLKEEYLWSEEYDEEEDEMRYEEEDICPDDLFYSFYYYSYQALLFCRPGLKQLKGSTFDKRGRELEELL